MNEIPSRQANKKYVADAEYAVFTRQIRFSGIPFAVPALYAPY